jgi:signal transduction histidine kinase
MNFIKLLPVILSMLLLGAHFFRYGNIALVLLSAALLPVLLVRKPWVIRLFQTVLVIGGIEWIRTLVVLAKMRQFAGEPWIRLTVILGAVAALTICSALVFRFNSLRERYKVT